MLGAEQWAWLADELDYSYAASPAHSEKEGTMEWDQERQAHPARPARHQLRPSSSPAHEPPPGRGAGATSLARAIGCCHMIADSGLQVAHTVLVGRRPLRGVLPDGHSAPTRPPLSPSCPVVDVTSSGLTHSTGSLVCLCPSAMSHPVMRWLFKKPSDRGTPHSRQSGRGRAVH